MGQMFDKTRNHMTSWRRDNSHAFRDPIDLFNPQTTSSGMVKHTGEDFFWYGSEYFRATIEPPSWQQYMPGDCLAVRPLN
jgi:hypothetical protein